MPHLFARQFFYGWVILAALMYVFFVVLAFKNYGAAILNTTMLTALKLPINALGTAFSAFSLIHGAAGPLVALVIDKIGVRRTILIGISIIVFGSISMATIVTDTWSFIVIFGGLFGIGSAFAGPIPAQTILIEWFIARRAFAFSILWLAYATGGAVVSPLLGYLIAATGDWRSGWWLLLGLSLAAALITLLVIRDRPLDNDQLHDNDIVVAEAAAESAAITTDVWTSSDAFRTAAFWLIAVSYTIFVVALTGVFSFAYHHLLKLEHGPEFAASLIGLVALLQIPGILAVGYLGSRVAIRCVLSASFLLMAIGLLLLAEASTAPLGYAFAFSLGIGIGIQLVASPIIVSNYFGPIAFPKLLAVIFFVSTALGSANAVAIGYYQAQIGYPWIFTVSGIALLAGAVLMICARAPKMQRSPADGVIQGSVIR